MPEIIICTDADGLADRAAMRIVKLAHQSVAEHGRFTIALAGGSTPEKTYARLAQPDRAQQIDWDKTYLFFSDERFVPETDPTSNYGMAQRSLLSAVPLPADHIFAVPTQLSSADHAAAKYNETLAEFFNVSGPSMPPRFDLILLGLGDDGHTASLFPHNPSLSVTDRWAVASPPGILPPPVDRITFTLPIINSARHVVFLVSGEKKAQVLMEVLETSPRVNDHPAAGVHPTDGTLTWLIDKPAAEYLSC